MARWLGSALILVLLALTLALPNLSMMSRGSEATVRADAPGAAGRVGQRLPDFTLYDLDGAPVRTADFIGKKVLLTFERSLDW